MEKPVRSISKAISWRLAATLTTILLVYAFTGNIVLGSSVGAAELIVKTLVYYVHERVWNRLGFGRNLKTS